MFVDAPATTVNSLRGLIAQFEKPGYRVDIAPTGGRSETFGDIVTVSVTRLADGKRTSGTFFEPRDKQAWWKQVGAACNALYRGMGACS